VCLSAQSTTKDLTIILFGIFYRCGNAPCKMKLQVLLSENTRRTGLKYVLYKKSHVLVFLSLVSDKNFKPIHYTNNNLYIILYIIFIFYF